MEAENNVHIDEIEERPEALDDAALEPEGEPQLAAADSEPGDEIVEEGPGAEAQAPAPPEASPKNWYIIHTYSGFENKVAESLRTRAEATASLTSGPAAKT